LIEKNCSRKSVAGKVWQEKGKLRRKSVKEKVRQKIAAEKSQQKKVRRKIAIEKVRQKNRGRKNASEKVRQKNHDSNMVGVYL
jgi:hypothetical protein